MNVLIQTNFVCELFNNWLLIQSKRKLSNLHCVRIDTPTDRDQKRLNRNVERFCWTWFWLVPGFRIESIPNTNPMKWSMFFSWLKNGLVVSPFVDHLDRMIQRLAIHVVVAKFMTLERHPKIYWRNEWFGSDGDFSSISGQNDFKTIWRCCRERLENGRCLTEFFGGCCDLHDSIISISIVIWTSDIPIVVNDPSICSVQSKPWWSHCSLNAFSALIGSTNSRRENLVVTCSNLGWIVKM